jgi:gliding motility-associated-like protein
MAQQLEPPVITSLDVEENGHVNVYWLPVSGASGYIIYRKPGPDQNDQGGELPIDTLYDGSAYNYFDNTSRADTCSYSYKLASLADDLNIDSPPSESSATIFLNKLIYDTCNNQVILNWSPYIGWGEDNVKYEIIKNDDNTNLIKTSELEHTDNVLAGQTYTYLIRARKIDGSSFTSNSNRMSITIPTLKIPQTPVITEITNDGSNFTAQILVDTDADLWGYKFMAASEQTGNYTVIDSLPLSSGTDLQFTQTSGNNPLFYKVAASNICEQIVAESEIIRPINLEYEQVDLDIILKWNPGFVENVENYDIYLSIDNSAFTLLEQAYGNTSINYTLDGSDFGNETAELFCFYVVGVQSNNYISQSNTQCLTRKPKVNMPNAFTPNGDGMNDYIQPEILNATVAEYVFIVYDRYGGKVFETDDPYLKWFGQTGNKNVGEGAYLYFLKFTTQQGALYEDSGTINVVYP